jgi:hypothetical protein
MFRPALVHLRSQWMGALALFFVLTGGTAYAANTIRSADIVNGQVKAQDIASGAVLTADIGNNQVRGIDVRNDSLTGGGLSGADIKESTLVAGGDLTGMLDALTIGNDAIGVNEPSGGANDEIIDGSVDSEDVQNNSLTGTDIADTGSLGNADISDLVRTIQIPANALIPAAQAEPAGSSPDIGFAGNTPALFFDQSTLEAVRIPLRIPFDRAPGTDLEVTVLWSASGGAGTGATWHFSYAAVTPAFDNVNVALTDGNVSTSTVVAANRLILTPFGSADIPGASVADGDLLQLRVFRDAVGEPDDLAQDAALHSIEISYVAVR